MEKKMLKLVKKPVTFQNQPNFSPNKFKNNIGKEFSGQIIPVEPRMEEPTSPKISCMGQIKHKNRQRNNKKLIDQGPKTKASCLRCFFSRPQEKRSGAPRPQPKAPERVCRRTDLSHMRRFASGRDTVAGFNWRTHVAPVDAKQQSTCYSNEDSEGENEVMIPFSAPIIIGELGACGKLDVDNLKPRKEINLWKRRTMAQPRPLQVAHLR